MKAVVCHTNATDTVTASDSDSVLIAGVARFQLSLFRGLYSHLGALLDATDRDFTYTAFHYQVEKHNNVTSTAFKLDKYEKQLSDIEDNFQLMRAGMLALISLSLSLSLSPFLS